MKCKYAMPIADRKCIPCSGWLLSRFVSLLIVALMLLPVCLSKAQDEDEPYGPRPMGVETSLERDKAAHEKYAGNPDVLVLPGLVANRKTRLIEVLAESTGLAAETELEFLLVNKDSSHGYEALLWSYAKPSDVHKALEFIGLKPGSPYNPAALRFWADGDPVNLSVSVDPDDVPVPIEQMVLDRETEMTLPEDGFVFTGSIMVPSPDRNGGKVYAGDAYDPRSVASLYNEPTAVLDVPRQANKGEVYGRHLVNPDSAFELGTLLTITMEPRETPDRAPIPRLKLALSYSSASTGVVYRLSGEADKILAEAPVLVPVLEKVSELRQDDIPPFVKLNIGDSLPVGELVKPCVSLAMMESLGMIRVDPPEEGALYYRAFVPQKVWMQPEGRPTQPWELHLRMQDGNVTGAMVLNEAQYSDASVTPTFTRRTVDVADPQALVRQLEIDAKEREEKGKSPRPSVILVFATPDLTYGDLLMFLKPVQSTHGTIYVFVVS